MIITGEQQLEEASVMNSPIESDNKKDLNPKIEILETLLTVGAVTIEQLKTRGVDINHQDINGKTMSHYAAQKDHIDTFVTLVRAGADLTLTDLDGNTTNDYVLESKDKSMQEFAKKNQTRSSRHGQDVEYKERDNKSFMGYSSGARKTIRGDDDGPVRKRNKKDHREGIVPKNKW